MLGAARFPELRHFFGCYFHEDWIDDVTSEAQAFNGSLEPEDQWYKRVVELYVSTDGPASATRAAAEIHALLGYQLSEPQLSELVTGELSCSYDPGDRLPFSEWLSDVAEQLTHSANRVA